ncbi:MAG: serine/threonine protein kinase [Porticoccaceae bacterium]|jgi:serine/threonine protein kinase
MSEPRVFENKYTCPWKHDFYVKDPPAGDGERAVCPLCGSSKTRVDLSLPAEFQVATVGADSTDSIDATIDATITAEARKQKQEAATAVADLPRYRMLHELGRGACGVVYRVRDEQVGRDVALKRLLKFTPRALQLFKQEFRSLADIAHPNLASLYDLHAEDGDWSFTMELLEAVEFNEYVWSGFAACDENCRVIEAQVARQGTRLSAPVIARLYNALRQVAAGLDTLHKAGVLHRDIKHSNIMVTTEGRVVLVDFGLAVDATTGGKGTAQGTPAFMAPEQCAGRASSSATDWYGIGVMLYEILTGQLPFVGSLEKILTRKRKEIPKEPREIEPSIPAELNELCMKLLQIKPADRPSVEEILTAIGADSEIELLNNNLAATERSDIELVGRDRQLNVLRDHFAQLVVDRPSGKQTDSEAFRNRYEANSVFVHGRSGMGKSVLVERFLQEIQRDADALVLAGRCYEQESVPFKALDNLMDSLASYLAGLRASTLKSLIPEDSRPLARVFPVFGQLPGINDEARPSIENAEQQELRQRAMICLRELLTRLGHRKKPLVLYVDDLQWGDEDSADLLVNLLRPPNSPQLLLLGSYRTEAIGTSPCLIELANEYSSGEFKPPRSEISVEALTEQESTTLALKLLVRDDKNAHEIAARIASESGGWPFFVWELTQGVQDDPDIANGALELDDVIWARACRLPEETRQFLELVAVVARPIPAAEAYRALDEVERGQSLLAQLRTASFVRTTTDEAQESIVESYHDRIRESDSARVDEATAQKHHLSMARVIEEACGITVEDRTQWLNSTKPITDEVVELTTEQWNRVFDLARHFSAGGQSDQALPYALIAAEQARRQDALEVAEQQFRVAEQGSADAPQHVQFRIANGLGDVLMLRGKYDEAEHRLTAAHEVAADEIVRAKTDRKLGELAFKRGRMQKAAEIIETALRNMGRWVPRSAAGYTVGVAWEGWIQLLHTLLPSFFVHRRKEIPTGAERVRITLMSRLAYLNWFARGTVPTLWSHLVELNRAERYLPSLELAQAWSEHAPAMSMVPLHSRGIRYAEKSLKIRRAHGHRWGMAQSLHFLELAQHSAGRLRESVENMEQAVEIFEQTGDWWEANLVRYQLGLAHYRLGNLDLAIDYSQRVHRSGIELGDDQASGISLHCWALAAHGDVPADIIQTELNRKRADAQVATQVLLAEALRLYYAKDLVDALARLDEAMHLIRKNSLRSNFIAMVYSWRATVLRELLEQESSDGRLDKRFLRRTKQAVRTARFMAWSYPIERPHALREAGEVALLQSRHEKSTHFFQSSIKEAERLEMSHEADRARARLDEL